MDKKDAIYTVILAASLFSLSLLLFSQGITNLSVSIRDEKPFAVSVPTLFSMHHVLIMLFFTAIGSHSLTILGRDLFTLKENTSSGYDIEKSVSLASDRLPRTLNSNSGIEGSFEPFNKAPLASHEAQFPVYKSEPPVADYSADLSEVAASEVVESKIAESDIHVNQNSLNKGFDRAEHKKKVALEILQGDEKALFVIISEKEEILQSDLVLESGFSKVKVSRVLQKLERKSLVKRKPFGNTNKVVLAK